MSRPRPKFCVGEEVIVYQTRDGNTRKDEVCRFSWVGIGTGMYMRGNSEYKGWAYQLAGRPEDDLWALETQLSKLPPEERTQWEDCAWQPTKQGVEA